MEYPGCEEVEISNFEDTMEKIAKRVGERVVSYAGEIAPHVDISPSYDPNRDPIGYGV